MDFDLDDDQSAWRDSCSMLLDRFAGPGRAREVRAAGDPCDRDLLAALDGAGFLDLFAEADAGPLAAALVAGWVAQRAGQAPVGARALVAPALGSGPWPRVVTVADRHREGPVRFAAQADLVVVIDGDEAILAPAEHVRALGIAVSKGDPIARVQVTGGERLGRGSGDVARRWWQVARAVEIAGAAKGALDLTVEFVKQREQFGRPIGSFQAVQHRLAEAAVAVDGVTWLAREAAWHGAPADLAAAASLAAVEMAGTLLVDLHQVTGAIGFTLEYDLHLWTMRLHGLRLEDGGLSGQVERLAVARWGSGAC